MELPPEVKVHSSHALWSLCRGSGTRAQESLITFNYQQCSHRILSCCFFFSVGCGSFQLCSGFLSWPSSLGSRRPGAAVCVLCGVLEAGHSGGKRMCLLAPQ